MLSQVFANWDKNTIRLMEYCCAIASSPPNPITEYLTSRGVATLGAIAS
ncbi:MAG: hypothetical protein F6K30_00425 [Cyanothece sp. SIO2G6]|nr:hypothetical protein [Cyanothece sp. SIO2G6]